MSTNPPEPKRVLRAIRAQMAKVAFSGFDRINARAALVMSRHGIIRQYEVAMPSHAALSVAQAVITATSPDPLAGPLIAVTDEASRHRTIDYSVFWLLNSKVEVRRLAWEFFSCLSSKHQVSVGPRLQNALAEFATPLRSSDIEQWAPAALDIFDAVQSDWHLNLAGLKQSLSWSFLDGANDFLPLVLRPSISTALDALNSTRMGKGGINGVRDLLQEVIHQSPSLSDVFKSYMSAVGHLPLTGQLSLRSVLERFGEIHPGQSPWHTLWENARSQERTFELYHLCIAFLWHPEWVPTGCEPELISCLSRIIAISGENGLEADDDSWSLRELLGTQYLRLLECHAPEFVDDTLASVAWLMASRVADCLELASESLNVINDIAKPEAVASEHLWRVTRPPGSQTPLRRATLLTPSIWALSAVAELASYYQTPGTRLDSFMVPGFEKVLARAVISLFPMTQETGASPIYGFQCLTSSLLDDWTVQDDTIDAIPELNALMKEIVKPDTLLGRLREFSSNTESEQVMACQAVQMLSPLRSDIRDLVWNIVQDRAWRSSFFENAPSTCVEMVGDTLIELQSIDSAKWLPAIPHFFASVIEECDLDDERKALLTAMTAVASISGGTTSALSRLKMSRDIPLQSHLLAWREKVGRMMNVPSPVSISRLRRCLPAFE